MARNTVEITKEELIEHQVRKKWRWIGNTMRKSGQQITRQALAWMKRRRPKPLGKDKFMETEMTKAGCRKGNICEKVERRH